jgi:site-specific DNA recombinase
MKPPVKYCAVYTRKSTEDGLEQEFNSLDAQREACLAYVTSQRSEGWVPVKEHYDDGGYSGGNTERPGLKRLMEDIKAGKINIVVVYKIDRLTRSLTDFSKLVEVFDNHGVTFVSVTQSFNTTTSMGRLTLNVLLSFAQFEREVTGERIRDKVAASKKKGMWMGGVAPLGYDVKDKSLQINKKEAETVRLIFNLYLELGCVAKLMNELNRRGIRSKVRVSVKERTSGGAIFSRGALYHLLRNPVFIGKVKHGDNIYEGQHSAILTDEIWTATQNRLSNQAALPRGVTKRKSEGYLLKGKLFDSSDNFYSPAYTNKNGKRYSYYVSQTLIQYKDHPKGILARLPALSLEKTIEEGVRSQLTSILNMEDQEAAYVMSKKDLVTRKSIFESIDKVVISSERLNLTINIEQLSDAVSASLDIAIEKRWTDQHMDLSIPFYLRKIRDGALVIDPASKRSAKLDPFSLPPAELKALVQGIVWRDEHFNGRSISTIARREGISDTAVGNYIHKCMKF